MGGGSDLQRNFEKRQLLNHRNLQCKLYIYVHGLNLEHNSDMTNRT